MVDPRDTEEPITTEPSTSEQPRSQAAQKGRQSFKKLRRELTDDELSTPAVQRMLLDEIDRLERENSDQSGYRDQFHVADKRASILTERLKRSLSADIIFGVCLTVGAAALSYAPTVWDEQPTGWLSIGVGVILIMSGIVSRAVVQR